MSILIYFSVLPWRYTNDAQYLVHFDSSIFSWLNLEPFLRDQHVFIVVPDTQVVFNRDSYSFDTKESQIILRPNGGISTVLRGLRKVSVFNICPQQMACWYMLEIQFSCLRLVCSTTYQGLEVNLQPLRTRMEVDGDGGGCGCVGFGLCLGADRCREACRWFPLDRGVKGSLLECVYSTAGVAVVVSWAAASISFQCHIYNITYY